MRFNLMETERNSPFWNHKASHTHACAHRAQIMHIDASKLKVKVKTIAKPSQKKETKKAGKEYSLLNMAIINGKQHISSYIVAFYRKLKRSVSISISIIMFDLC